MRKKLSIFIVTTFTILSLGAQNEMQPIQLNEVQIDANKSKIYPDALRIVNTIEKNEIEKIPVQNLNELLDRIAGIDARQRSNGGVQADISIRGGSFDQVLILLNGINITDPQTGHYNMDVPVELSDISRIEILQGSAARIYGPNAFSGAINIITGANNKSQLKSNNEAGSYGYLGQSVSAVYHSEPFQTFATASYKQSDGFIKNTDFKTVNAFWQSKINTKSAGYFRFQLSAQSKKYGANNFYSLKYPDQFENTKTFLASLEWNYEKNFYTINAQAYLREHLDKFDLLRYSDTNTPNYHKTDVTGGKITTLFHWKAGKTSLGFDIRNEHIFSNNLGKTMDVPVQVPFEEDSTFYTKKDDRLLGTITLDHSIDVGNWNVAGGFSTTFNKQFGTHTNGGADVGYKLNQSLRIYTGLNTALRLPTFTNLYYQDATHISNPNLVPEKSITWELGSKFEKGNIHANAVIFYRTGKNVIDWVKLPEEDKWRCKNLTDVNAIGTDLNAEYRFTKSFVKDIHLAYSFLNLDKQAEDYDSQYALDYLRNKIIIGLGHKIYRNLSADWNLSWYDRGGTYTLGNKLYRYTTYALLNTRISWRNKKVLIHADVNNLMNQKYVEYGGIEQPRINYLIGLQLNI